MNQALFTLISVCTGKAILTLWDALSRHPRRRPFVLLFLALALQGCDNPNSLKNQAFGVRLGMSRAEVAHAVEADAVPNPSLNQVTVHDKGGNATLYLTFKGDRVESITAMLPANTSPNESLDIEGLWKWFRDFYIKDLGSPDTASENSVSWDFKRARQKRVCISHDTAAVTISLEFVNRNSGVPANAGLAFGPVLGGIRLGMTKDEVVNAGGTSWQGTVVGPEYEGYESENFACGRFTATFMQFRNRTVWRAVYLAEDLGMDHYESQLKSQLARFQAQYGPPASTNSENERTVFEWVFADGRAKGTLDIPRSASYHATFELNATPLEIDGAPALWQPLKESR